MARLKGGLFLVFGIALLAAPAFAQVGGRPFEISGTAGFFAPDIRARMQSGPAYTAGAGWRFKPFLTLEANGLWAPSHADTVPELAHNFSFLSADLKWNLRPAEEHMVPFLLVGYGVGNSHSLGSPLPEKLQRGAPSLGLGVKVNAFDQRSYLRIQVRDVMFRERDQTDFSNHIAATIGLEYEFGGKVKDQDLDGVRDWKDNCPSTPLGATVDKNGCPSDGDGDGVLDGIDKCPDTPKGCPVDKAGCSKDTDGDGVCDGLDKCAATPKGATVDATGCPSDADGDGVLDGIDTCPNTPKGATVDATGCPKDTDGDGVDDGIDICPNTPAGLQVDPRGCPIEVNEKETQLLDTGTIRVMNINFDTGKATIKPESFAVIDTVARVLIQYPMLKIEIGGHTDNVGTPAKNDALSQARADTVLQYMKRQFPGLDASQYVSKGYGPTVPVAPNTTSLGKAKNRRVEFKVMNVGMLRIEREKRRFVKKDETVPAVTPSPSDSIKTMPATPAPADTSKKVPVSPAPVAPAPADTTKKAPVSPAPADTTKH
jgi:OOP family OmpA-OmpF porin